MINTPKNWIDMRKKIKINEMLNHNPQVIIPIICPSCNNPVEHVKEDIYRRQYFYCQPCNIYYEMSFELINGRVEVHFTAREAENVSPDGSPVLKLVEPEEPQVKSEMPQEKPTVPPDGTSGWELVKQSTQQVKKVSYHKNTQQKLLDIMKVHKRVMKTSEFVEMTGFHINIVSRTLTKMKNEGIIKKYGHGKYGLS